MSLTESYTAAFGNFIGRLLLGLTAVWTLLALARTASGAAAAFPEGDGAGMAPAVLMALTAWVCIRGENAPARCAAVLAPLLAGSPAQYRAYICRLGGMAEPRTLPAGGLTLVEGSYALHPDLWVPLVCNVFVTCDPACQRRRLQTREGERFEAFARRWIPLEEGYLTACTPEKTCDFVLDTTAMTV